MRQNHEVCQNRVIIGYEVAYFCFAASLFNDVSAEELADFSFRAHSLRDLENQFNERVIVNYEVDGVHLQEHLRRCSSNSLIAINKRVVLYEVE